MKTKLRLAVVAFALVLAVPARAWACSCEIPRPLDREAALDREVARAAAVFVGTVQSVRSTRETQVVRITTERWWKGEPTRSVVIRTPSEGAACGFGFVAGERYIVLANRGPDGTLWVSLCGASTLASRAPAELRKRLPARGGSLPPPAPRPTPARSRPDRPKP